MTAQDTHSTMSATVQAQHQAAWTRVETAVLGRVKKGAKVYEAHHAVAHARKLYLAELAKGLPSDLCERAVLRAYGM